MLPTTRRSLFPRLAVLFGGGAGMAMASNASATMPVPKGFQSVVYHLSDIDKVAFVLGNIHNHIEGKGGPANIRIALVVHGPALTSFVSGHANPKTTSMVEKHVSQGVTMLACGNTMRAQDIKIEDLLPGFDVVSEGGVTRLADLQAQGWLYLRP